jgi:DNA ligase (NAD+)
MTVLEFLLKLQKIDKISLVEEKGLGPILISNFDAFLKSPRYKKMLQELEKMEKEGNIIHLQSPNQQLGISVAITGSFDASRNLIIEKIENLGLKFTKTISSGTNIVLVGENPGSTLEKAQNLNLKILYNLDDFKDYLANEFGLIFSLELEETKKKSEIETNQSELLF